MPIRTNKSVMKLEKANPFLIMDVPSNLFHTKKFSILLIYVIIIGVF